MLGKLLKYDFKSTLRPFGLLWLAAVVMGYLGSLAVGPTDIGLTAAGITITTYIVVMAMLGVVSYLFIIQRFYKGLLGDEGYLMHTLPVRPWQLITSKLLCSMAVLLVSILVAALSVLLLVSTQPFYSAVDAFSQILNAAGAGGVAQLVVGGIVTLALQVLRLYAAMSLGHLFAKHRVAWSFVFFLVLEVVEGALSGFVGDTDSGVGFIFSAVGDLSVTLNTWPTVALSVVVAAAYFLVTSYILGHKLNLE
jgi:hypothetical protein